MKIFALLAVVVLFVILFRRAFAHAFVNPVRVACVGDSITEGEGAAPGRSYPSQLQKLLGNAYRVRNFGVGGRTLLRKGDYPYWNERAFKNAQSFAPDVVIIMLGTNDTKPQNWKYRDEFLDNYRELVDTFRRLPADPRVFVCRLCPVPEPGNFDITEAHVLRIIPIIDQVAMEKNLGVIDMHATLAAHPETLPDLVHPNTAGAALMAAAAHRALTASEPRATRSPRPADP
jgi:acyl-CoA thioesterase I